MKKYNVLIERDLERNYIASVQGLQGMYTQGKTYEEAIKNIKEVISVWREIDKNNQEQLEFMGIQAVEV